MATYCGADGRDTGALNAVLKIVMLAADAPCVTASAHVLQHVPLVGS